MKTSFLSHIKFTLFGSSAKNFYNPSLSIYENFNAMCSLNICKVRSAATRNLANILQDCNLNSLTIAQQSLTRKERRQDIIVLELAKLALSNWLTKRSQISTRPHLIKNFFHVLAQMQHVLIKQDNHEVLNAEVRPGKIKYWRNPLCDKKTINEHLSQKQKTIFWQLKTSECNLEYASYQSKKFGCYTFLVTAFNYLLEWDFLLDVPNFWFEIIQFV